MRYPKFLPKNGTIGVTAPSLGYSQTELYPYTARARHGMTKIQKAGYHVITTDDVFNTENKNVESAPAPVRAQQLMELYLNPQADLIFSAAGGERMLEILDYLDFDKLSQAEPKFFVGMSDNTNFSFTLTTICDVASVYAQCFGDFGMEPWDDCVVECLQVLSGTLKVQHSYSKYQIEDLKFVSGHHNAPFNKTEPVVIENLRQEASIQLEGRQIGGCLDVLQYLLGTKFDNVVNFTKKYAKDGIIWYLEACDLNPAGVVRTLVQMKRAGWFQNGLKGFVFGRPRQPAPFMGYSHQQALLEILGDLNVPIIFGADFGHVSPTFTIINGAMAKITSTQNRLTWETIYK